MKKKLQNIIEALGKHQDENSIKLLEEFGTNCPVNEVRELTAKALIRKNTTDALSIVIAQKGKGINDLSAGVAMSAINELLSLNNKDEAMKVLEDTINNSGEKEVQDTARSVKALMSFSF